MSANACGCRKTLSGVIQAENTARKLLILRSTNIARFTEITVLVPFSTATPVFVNHAQRDAVVAEVTTHVVNPNTA
jgi:hypothetical protein